MFYFDMSYIIFILPALLFSMYAQSKVSSTFSKYSKTANRAGFTGADIARQLLRMNGITEVQVEHIAGNLTDHYDPRSKTLRLSDAVYSSRSLAAIGVAAHETGHAIQHDTGYVPLNIRSAIVPVVNISSKMAMPVIMLGAILGGASPDGGIGSMLINVGLLLFAGAVVFSLITLPVELDASKRAIEMLDNGILVSDEIRSARKVLNAAAMTYVAAAATSVAMLLRLLYIFGRRRRD